MLVWVSVGHSSYLDHVLTHRIRVMGGCDVWVWWVTRRYSGWCVTLQIILNIDTVPVVSRSHTHPSHSETSRLLTSSLSLGVPVPESPSVYESCSSLSFDF